MYKQYLSAAFLERKATTCKSISSNHRSEVSLLFDTPYLSSGLSLEQIVGLSLVHSSLCFLGCESWARLN